MNGWGDRQVGHARGVQDAVRRIKCTECGKGVRHDLSEYGICMRCLYMSNRRGPNAMGWRRGVTVLKCPHREIVAGSRFDLFSFRETLRAGSWPLGMIVRSEGGIIKCVCGVGKAYRHLADEYPPQWLRGIA